MEQTSDEFVYTNSSIDDFEKYPFLEKVIEKFPDSNNQSHRGEINFNNVFSTSGRMQAISEAQIVVPYMQSIQSDKDITGVSNTIPNPYITSFKSGTQQLLSSIQVSLNGYKVLQRTDNLNQYVDFYIKTNWGQDTLEKYGDLTFNHIDDASGYLKNTDATGSPDGKYFCNNRVFGDGDPRTFTASTPKVDTNKGLRKRLLNNANYKDGNGGTGWVNVDTLNDAGKCYYDTEGSGADRIYKFYFMAVIRLKDLPLFSKLPLMRGVKLDISIRYNACRYGITVTNGVDKANNMYQTSYTQLYGNCNPMMLASGKKGNPMYQSAILKEADDNTTSGATVVLTCECNVGQTVNPQAFHSIERTCYLYIPTYRLDERYQMEYLSKGVKTIEYNDIINDVYDVPASSTSFSKNISDQVVNPKQLIIIPFDYSETSDTTFALNSPFDTAPGTPHGIVLSDLNITVSGRNVWNEPIDYDFENFSNELAKTGANGGSSNSVGTGLISYRNWSDGMRYYVADLSRISADNPGSNLSITVKGKKKNGLAVRLYFFITYGRSLSLDLNTGFVTSQ